MRHRDDARLNRQFDELERRFPGRPARLVSWLRRPGSRLVRIPLGVLLIFGGVFSFLPVLGIWMLPLGLLLLALDVPFLQGPVAGSIVWGRRKWSNWRKRRKRA
jgi:hypothetical protein